MKKRIFPILLIAAAVAALWAYGGDEDDAI